ncbi:MAG TPA: hypothetical protein VKA60_09710 [Blastocatellia bacterium]|nr:hypothetical protein [Blastocatellia bacterium]
MNAKRICQTLTLCALLALTVSPVPAQDAANTQGAGRYELLGKKSQGLVGTWATRITPPPESGVPAFPGFFTFTSDGNLIATQSGGELPALGNPQIGLWEYAGGSQFTITYFLQDFDAQFQQVASEEEHATVTVNAAGDQFTGMVDINVYDLDGHLLFSDCCATFEGKRLGVKPPHLNNFEPQAQRPSPGQPETAAPASRQWGWGRKHVQAEP